MRSAKPHAFGSPKCSTSVRVNARPDKAFEQQSHRSRHAKTKPACEWKSLMQADCGTEWCVSHRASESSILCCVPVCRRAVVVVNETQSAELTLQFLPSTIVYGAFICLGSLARCQAQIAFSPSCRFYSFPATESLPLGAANRHAFPIRRHCPRY